MFLYSLRHFKNSTNTHSIQWTNVFLMFSIKKFIICSCAQVATQKFSMLTECIKRLWQNLWLDYVYWDKSYYTWDPQCGLSQNSFLQFLHKIPIFLKNCLTHQWPYKFNKPQRPYHSQPGQVLFLRHFTPGRQWPYKGLTDRGFLNLVCETVVWSLTFRVENVFEKKMKKTRSVRLRYGHWRIGSKTELQKKRPGLSDSDMVIGG